MSFVPVRKIGLSVLLHVETVIQQPTRWKLMRRWRRNQISKASSKIYLIFSKSLKCLLFFYQVSLIKVAFKCLFSFLIFDLYWTFCTVFELVRLRIIYSSDLWVLCQSHLTKIWMVPIKFCYWKDTVIEI